MGVFQSTDDLWEKVMKKSNKTMKSLDEDVASLDKWLKSQSHLPQDLLNTNSLRNFLLLNKFSVEVAKQKIDSYFTLRVKFEEVYGKCHPKLEFNKIFCNSVYAVPSLKLSKEMYRIGYFKFKDESLVDLFEPLSLVKRLLTMQDLRLRTDVMYGDVLVADIKHTPISILAKAIPSLIYRTVQLYEKVYSIPLKAVYVINVPSFGHTILSLFKAVMKPKLFERIHIVGDADIMKDLIPLDLLPHDFGGEGPALATIEESLDELYEENSKLFSCLEEMTITESLRSQSRNDDVFGIYGNFKKLDVD